MQILDWQSQKLRKRAVAVDDAHHRAAGAMLAEAPQTQAALPARDVDFSDHTSADGPARVFAFDDFADKFVAENAMKGGIALQYFPVGAANPRQAHPHQRLAGLRPRLREVPQSQLPVEVKSLHQ